MLKYLSHILLFNLLLVININADQLEITSDKLEVDRIDRVSTFSGNVYAHNMDIEIWSEKLIIKFHNSESEIQQVNVADKVKIMGQDITATGEAGVYFPNEEKLNVYGNVEVIENDNYVKCDELLLGLKNSTSIMTSNSSKRVEAIIINK